MNILSLGLVGTEMDIRASHSAVLFLGRKFKKRDLRKVEKVMKVCPIVCISNVKYKKVTTTPSYYRHHQ